VPWILHHPAIDPGISDDDTFVQQIDMLPTILEMLEIDLAEAERGHSRLAGTSRWSDIRGDTPSPRLTHSIMRTQFLGADKGAVVTPEYKLILNFDHDKRVVWRERKDGYHHPPPQELYRYLEDPRELSELNEPEIAQELEGLFREWEERFPPLVESGEVAVSPDDARLELEALRALGYVADE
jgi:arylsulfatase A-like enzyme